MKGEWNLKGFNKIFAVAWRVLRQIGNDKRTCFLLVFNPLFILVLFGSSFSGNISNVNVACVNEDGAQDVNFGESIFSVWEEDETVSIKKLDSFGKALDEVRDGKITAAVRIPQNFTQEIVTKNESNIYLSLDGTDPMVSKALLASFMQAVQKGLENYTKGIVIQKFYVYGENTDGYDFFVPAVIGLSAFFFIFALSIILIVREKVEGTQERLRATPLKGYEIMTGYIISMIVISIIQTFLLLGVAITVFQTTIEGNIFLVFLLVVLVATVGASLGIVLSTYAKTEFQAMQFIPLILLPSILISGLFWPINSMPSKIQPASYFIPITYSNRGLRNIMLKGFTLNYILIDLFALIAMTFLSLIVASKTWKIIRE